MEVDSPVFRDDSAKGGADFFVHDLEIDSVAALFKSLHYDFVCSDAVATMFGLERLDQDCVAVEVVREHYVLVAAA